MKYPEMKHKGKKYSVYSGNSVKSMKDSFFEQGHKATICSEHIILANMVNDLVEDSTLKKQLLDKVDILYDMGKRMGNKLQSYHNQYVKKGGWRDGF